jgi:hypothetical protein
MKKISFLALLAALFGCHLGAAQSLQLTAEANVVTEWAYTSSRSYADPFNEVELDVLVTGPDGQQQRIPAFWGGENQWRVRFAASRLGVYRFQTVCSNRQDRGLHHRQGTITVEPYTGRNPLLRHGPIRLNTNAPKRHLQHADGTPFFWLADSWWLGMRRAFRWPEDFQYLTTDRVNKGFSVIQFAVAFPCDIAPFDERGANEAGHAWDTAYRGINPAYFDLTDQRVGWLVRSGLVPNIVGTWAYYGPMLGLEKLKKHWRYVIARYGAYPVAWTLAGEITLPYYPYLKDGRQRDEKIIQQRQLWTEMAHYVKASDPFGRLLTAHPGPFAENGQRTLDDASPLDFIMLMPGHGDKESLANGYRHMVETKKNQAYSGKPFMMGEIVFEGMHGESREKVQRVAFWSAVLSGAVGHCYGADAIWQFNTRNEPFGASPTGITWGNAPWEDACQWLGATHVGIGRKILQSLAHWQMEPHPEWVSPGASFQDVLKPYAAGVPNEWRLIYFPKILPDWQDFRVKELEPGIRYRATFIDPTTGQRTPIGEVARTDEKGWRVPPGPILQDWLVLLERVR